MRRRPLVTAIVSTYNGERLLPGCLEDLEAQTIADDLEIVVIDSGSEQDERGVVQGLQRRFDNIVYRRTRRETLYAAWNRGIRMARGRYVTNANTDDAHRPDALEIQTLALEAHPEADLVYGDYAWTSMPNDTFADPHTYRTVVHPPYHPAQAMFFCVTGCHPMWRRTLFGRLGLFDATFTAPGDYEYFMRFAAAGLRAVHVPEVLSLFYQNPTGLTSVTPGREIQRVYATYRGRTPIHRLYRVDPRKPAEVARAWVAQGNYAMRCALPYGDEHLTDETYAELCYRRALDKHPASVEALHDLIVLMVLQGRSRELSGLLARLPAERRELLRADLRRGRPRLAAVHVPPAVEPLEFARGPRAARVAAPHAPTVPEWIDLGTIPRATVAFARRIAGAGRPAERGPLPRDRAVRGRLRPRIAAGRKIRKAQDGAIVSGGPARRIHYLNRTAALVLELCNGRNTWDEIVDLVRLAYDLPRRPQGPVGRVLRQLHAEGVIAFRGAARRRRARTPARR